MAKPGQVRVSGTQASQTLLDEFLLGDADDDILRGGASGDVILGLAGCDRLSAGRRDLFGARQRHLILF